MQWAKHTQAPRLIDEEYLTLNFADEEIRETIINGTDKMPPQRKNVTDKEITEIIKYLRYSQKAAGLETRGGRRRGRLDFYQSQ